MPRGDGSGPNGMGPMTGRGLGFCAGYATPGFANPGFGGGFGRGFGRGMGGGGRGRRNMYYATGLPGYMRGPAFYGPAPMAPAVDEADVLRQQAEYLEQSLENVKRRLDELKNASDNA